MFEDDLTLCPQYTSLLIPQSIPRYANTPVHCSIGHSVPLLSGGRKGSQLSSIHNPLAFTAVLALTCSHVSREGMVVYLRRWMSVCVRPRLRSCREES